MRRIFYLITILLLITFIFVGGCSDARRFPTSEEVRAVVPEEINTGEEVLLFDAFEEDHVVPGAEGSYFCYAAYYNKSGKLKKIEFYSFNEICCNRDDLYEATYDRNYKLRKYHYENGRNLFVRIERNMHHYF